MFEQLKRLFKHTAVYGIGDVLNRIAAFLLLPLYTHYLTPEEFGSLEMLYLTSTILTMFLGRQLAHSVLRFYYEYEEKKDRDTVVSTAFITVFMFSGIVLIACSNLSDKFSILIFSSAEYAFHFGIIFLCIFLELTNEISLAYLRALEKSILFISITFIGLIIRFGATIYLVAYQMMNIEGVLLGNLSGIAAIWIVLSLHTLMRCGLRVHKSQLKSLLKYAIPLMFVGFSGMVIASSDRFFLKFYISLSAVGIYALGLRFKSVINFLVINPFTRGYGPFRFSIMKNQDAGSIYSLVTTYFFLALCSCWLVLSVLSPEVIKIMADDSYYDASKLIPILMASGVMQGMYYMFQTGVYIKKNTRVLAKMFAVAALLNVGLLFLIIPHLKVIGAAWVHLITRIFVTFGGLYFSQKVFPIKYEWVRMTKISVVAVTLYLSSHLIRTNILLYAVSLKAFLILLFPLILILMRFLTSMEKRRVFQALVWLKSGNKKSREASLL